MASNSPSPQLPAIGHIGSAQVGVSETKPTSFSLQVTALQAKNLPRLKTFLGKKRRFYTTIIYGETTTRTRSVRSIAQRVEWNESMDLFAAQPLSRMTVSLYAAMTTQKDILVGRQEIACEPGRELDIVFGNVDGHTRSSTEPVTLSLTIAMSPDASSSLAAAVSTNAKTANLDACAADKVVERQSNREIMQSTEGNALLSSSRTGDLPIERSPVADTRTEMSHTLDSAEGAMDAVKTWKTAVHVIKQVMDNVGPIVTLLPHAKLAWEMLSKIPEILLHQFERDDNVRTLLQAIRDAFEIANEADILRNLKPASTQAKILDEMLECVSECATFIISYAEDVQVLNRTLKNTFGGVDGKIEQYRSNLFRLRDNFLSRAAVVTEVSVLEAELGAIIRELPYKGGWRFGNEKRCLPGTREAFLDHIHKWVENTTSKHALVLFGQAGMGKSSIAHEISRHFENKCLGSYFTFLRKEGSKRDAYQLFTTLARDLSDRHSTFKLALGKVVQDNSSLRSSRDYHILYERLLLEPLRNLNEPLPGPTLIVIDALDESGDAIGRNGLHTFLAQRLVDLPSSFRVFVTSRPEDGVERAFANATSFDTIYMDDAKLASSTEQDILVYLQRELSPDVFRDHGIRLAKAAEGIFQWATVACGFINSPESLGLRMETRVERLLGHSRGRSGEGPLDSLYEEVLKQYCKTHEAQALFRTIMGQLLAAIEPLSIDSLITLRRHSPIDDSEDSVVIIEILGHLGSLLSNVTSSDHTRPIIPLHTSFRDFLTNKTSNVFYVDLGHSHQQLAHSSLGLMLNDLKFNICELESSYLANCDVPDLESRIAKYIPPALSYACIFWVNHLEHVVSFFEKNLLMKLESLFETKFLFWLEVLSLKSSVGVGLRGLSNLLKKLQHESSQTNENLKNLLAFVHDAAEFVRYFGIAVTRSAPHIYVSALPFAPSSSLILKQYHPLFRRTLSLEYGQLFHWPALKMTIGSHNSPVNSIAFSPDGQCIASGSDDRTIRVWDAAIGEAVAGPFIGHTRSVTSVAFSPDGQRIASASWDGTIRVWNVATGEVVAGPFTGNTTLVHSVAFSPDGHRIASASSNLTIRVWDAATGELVTDRWISSSVPIAFSPDGQSIASALDGAAICIWDIGTGEVVAGPFTGHARHGWVRSVAFSPDGHRIASASDDHTVRVWDAATGEVAAGPFTGHTDVVCSIVFSQDGQHIASGSWDHTIRVWDAMTGEVVAGPFTGHTQSVSSVAFSPDRLHIASSSYDHTIRLWDAAAGEVIVGPSTGHASSINEVAFSPDGQRIASASSDNTICVWDSATGEVVAGPFIGHTELVSSVAFSPDGHRIASASFDKTIRVWNVTTGEVVAGPFIRPMCFFFSVAFSPDGQRIASASNTNPNICVWDAATGEVVAGSFPGRTELVYSVAFSPDGRRIASALGHTIRVWDATTGDVVAGPSTGHTEGVWCVAFSPDGHRIASASGDHTIRVWDAATGEVVAGPFTGHTESVNSVAFSPDGHRIASASGDHTIRVWDAVTGEVIAGPFTGHTSWVKSVAFSPDGKHTVSASIDGVIRMENVTAENIQNTHFTDQSVINSDGWICGKEGELLLWIPALHRACLHRPGTFWAAGGTGTETRLDFSKFVHGSDWAKVYDHNVS